MEKNCRKIDSLGLAIYRNRIEWSGISYDSYGVPDAIIRAGARTFDNGIVVINQKEVSSTARRGERRRLMRQYDHRRTRKIKLIELLSELNMCPEVSKAELNRWRHTRIYDLNQAFREWTKFKADSGSEHNPFTCRHLAITSSLDLEEQEGRYILGRALYHLAQRRGYASKALDRNIKDDVTGAVKKGIADLTAAMKTMKTEHLGEFYYQCYRQHIKIVGRYTGREEHQLPEFEAICRRQNLDEETAGRLRDTIFFQRGITSGKERGTCEVEPTRTRTFAGHPYFEEFRMWQTINNFKVSEDGEELHQLSEEQKDLIIPLFYRKSKPHFHFDEVAKKIAGKRSYSCKGQPHRGELRFNYAADQTVTGCPMSTQIIESLGLNPRDAETCRSWKGTLLGRTDMKCADEFEAVDVLMNHLLWSRTLTDGKTMMKYSAERTAGWLTQHYGIEEEQAAKLTGTDIPTDSARLSAYVIRRILPEMIRGAWYQKALILGSLDRAVPAGRLEQTRRGVEETCSDTELLKRYYGGHWQEAVRDYLQDNGADISRIWFPNISSGFRTRTDPKTGMTLLGSPKTPNMRSMQVFRVESELGGIINGLIREGLVTRKTRIVLLVSNEVNTRAVKDAIKKWVKDNELRNQTYVKEIREWRGEDARVSHDDIVRYRLWEEQGHIDIYTGKTIGIEDVLGKDSRYGIRYTVPLSRGGDTSLMNQTLTDCSASSQRSLLPSELDEERYREILDRLESIGWESLAAKESHQERSGRDKARTAGTPESKATFMRQAAYHKRASQYWSGKMKRFTMKEVPLGFAEKADAATAEIRSTAVRWLQSYFGTVTAVNADLVASMREAWGFESAADRKDSGDSRLDAIDASVIACINPAVMNMWRKYWKQKETSSHYYDRMELPAPWPTFKEEVSGMTDILDVRREPGRPHDKLTRKKARTRDGRIIRDSMGNPIYRQGDTVRQQIHDDGIFGARMKENGELGYCAKKALPEKNEKTRKDILEIIEKSVDRNIAGALAKWLEDDSADTVFHWNGNPVYSVRCWVRATNPIAVRRLTDESRHPYKRFAYSTSAGNSLVAIYVDEKGKQRGQAFKANEKAELPKNTIMVLRMDDTVYMYENSPAEIRWDDPADLNRRKYFVKGCTLPQLKLQRVSTDSPSGKPYFGAWKNGLEAELIVTYATQLKCIPEKKKP